jgi:hypothetical protein
MISGKYCIMFLLPSSTSFKKLHYNQDNGVLMFLTIVKSYEIIGYGIMSWEKKRDFEPAGSKKMMTAWWQLLTRPLGIGS